MSTKVQAIRILCDGESRATLKDFETYRIPPTHDIFSQGELSQVSNLVGMPLLLLKLRPSMTVPRPVKASDLDKKPPKPAPTYSSLSTAKYFPNGTAKELMLHCVEDGSGNQLPYYPPDWDQRVGSVLIARKDGEPLHVAQITIMLGYLNLAAEHYRANPGTELATLINPGTFQPYYDHAMQCLSEPQVEQKIEGPHNSANVVMEEVGGVAV